MSVFHPGYRGTGVACGLAALVLLATAFAGAAGAGAEGQSASESKSSASAKVQPGLCVDVSNIFSRQVIDKNKLRVEDGFGRSAILTLSQPCSNMDELDHIGFEMSASGLLCRPHDVKILHSRYNEKPLTCLITDLKVMTREETKKDNEAARKGGATGE
jgi:hypothetical protein